MPVPAAIAPAAELFGLNNNFTTNYLADLSPEEWVKRPEGTTNHITWIVGHIIWSRSMVMARLGAQWSKPWMGLFARGQKLDDAGAYPSPDALKDAWKESAAMLASALANATDEQVGQPAPQPGPPSADGKMSGFIRFMAWHETYHVGQVSMLRGLLGHKGLMG